MNQVQVVQGRIFVAVIDDQIGTANIDDSRRERYERCFERLNAIFEGRWVLDCHYCAQPTDVLKLRVEQGQPKLAVVDMLLDEPAWSTTSVRNLDNRLRSEGWPLILVSAHFGSQCVIERANSLVGDSADRNVPFQFLMWSAVERAADGIETDDLAFIVNAVLARSQHQDLRFQKAANESIQLLHITDAHFGKAKWDVGSLMSLRATREKYGLGSADFLAATGDIANECTPEQYALAIDYFRALADNHIVARVDAGTVTARTFVCPGNHDFSRPISLAANIVAEGDGYKVDASINPCNSWIRGYAWLPYEHFEKELSNRAAHWILDPGFRVNTEYQSVGVVVLELCVERFAIEGYQAGASDDRLKEMLSRAASAVAAARRSRQCLVVLAHRHESNLWAPLAQAMSNTLRGLATGGPVILLCGHEHSERVGAEWDNAVLLVRGTPSVEGPERPKGTLPQLNCISLERENGAVSRVVVHRFHQSATGWLVCGDRESVSFSYDGQYWR